MTFSLSYFLGAIIFHFVLLVLFKIYHKPLVEWVTEKSLHVFWSVIIGLTVASVIPWVALALFGGWKTAVVAFICCWAVEIAVTKWLNKKSGFSKEEVYVTL